MTTEPKAPNPSPRARKTRTARPKPKVRMVKRAREEGDNPGTGHWRVYFLEHLIETSNISASARHAGTIPSRAYRTRKHDPLFAAAWDAALIEGYKNLEMDVLAYLRNPSPEHKMDVASASRCACCWARSCKASWATIRNDPQLRPGRRTAGRADRTAAGLAPRSLLAIYTGRTGRGAVPLPAGTLVHHWRLLRAR